MTPPPPTGPAPAARAAAAARRPAARTPHARRRAVRAALLTAVVAAGLAGPAGPATADPATGNVRSELVPLYDPQRGPLIAPPDEAAAFIHAYWTPERMREARPLVPDPQPDAPPAPPGPATDGEPQVVAEPAPPAAPAVAAAGVRLARMSSPVPARTHLTVGLLYGVDDRTGEGRLCSAAAVNSDRRRLVVTAAHCIHGGRGQNWLTNVAFVPGFHRGGKPAGLFPAHELWVTRAWTTSSNAHWDYGIMVTGDNEFGQRLVDRVGGNGLIIEPGRPYVSAVGYPSNHDDGNSQVYCEGQLSRRSLTNSDQELPCWLARGASGGPMLARYDHASRLGYIVSNLASLLPGDHHNTYGPYYYGPMLNLYRAAEAASP